MKNIYSFKFIICLIALPLLFSQQVEGQALANFNIKTVGNTSPTGMYYAEYLPPGFSTSTNSCGYPMMIVLHGLGEKGPNDGSQLSKVTVHGPAKHIKNGHDMCFTVNGKEECFVVIAPQLDVGNWTPARIRAYYDDVMSNPNVGPKIDSNRVYLTGLSLGGMGTYWHMINPVHNNPNVFAAFAPICGQASTTIGCSFTALNVPMWTFHGTNDNTVPYANNLALYNNILACTSPPPNPNTDFIFTSYPGVGHNSWSRAYNTGHTYHNPNLYEWMLSKTLPMTKGNCLGLNNINLNTNQICKGDTIVATMSTPGFNQFYWELDSVKYDSVATVKVSPSVGTHTLRVAAKSCDCITDTTFTITVIDGPIAKINASSTEICSGDSLYLESDTSIDNTWLYQGNSISNNQGVYVKQDGNYSLIVDHNGACADTTDLKITVNDSIVPVISYTNGELTSTVANTYEWYLNDTLISGVNTQSFTPSTNGDYKVRTLDTNGCYATSANFALTYIGVGQVPHGSFEVYPNPTVGELNVKIFLNGDNKVDVKVVDLRGAVITEKQFTRLNKGWQNLKIGFEDVTYRGTAIVVVSTATETGSQRVVLH